MKEKNWFLTSLLRLTVSCLFANIIPNNEPIYPGDSCLLLIVEFHSHENLVHDFYILRHNLGNYYYGDGVADFVFFAKY